MIINVKARPGSKENKVEKISDSEYIVSVKAQAEEGKANIAIIKLLSKYFDVSYKQVFIKNPSSRKKIIEIIN